MATTATLTQFLLHRHIFRPLRLSTTVPFSLLHHPQLCFSLLKTQIQPLSSSFPLFCSLEENINVNNSDNFKEIEATPEPKIAEENINLSNSEGFKENEATPEPKIAKIKVGDLPNLSVKEKKDLCSYANSLGDKLKSQQVGKSGVTDNVVFALSETLEANELLKLKIHRTCPGEMDDIVKQLELATGSIVVGQIGRTVIFYRPSLTKLEAERKKERNRKLIAQRREKAQAAFMNREQFPKRPRGPGRGQFVYRRSEKVTSTTS